MKFLLCFISILTVICLSFVTHAATKVRFYLSQDSFDVVLYDFTPKHKLMFLTAIKSGEYSHSLFNRIVANFVVQGGVHDVDIAAQEKQNGKSNGRLMPEFDERAYHKLGALGAGRDDNKDKASFFNQIYFVVGKPWDERQLDSLSKKTGKNWTLQQKKDYLKLGGQPRLDNDYTVFGEVISGIDVLMRLSMVPVDKEHYPLEEIYFSVKVLQE
jgi:cyclophilin family peptidyl-prolyl cis-trans isomerase